MRTTTWLASTGLGIVVGGFWGCGISYVPAAGAGGAASSSTQTATATVVGPTATTTGMGPENALAAACSKDADCGAGLRGIVATSDSPALGGGAGSGYCTQDCIADKDCKGEGSACLIPNGADKGECFLGCVIGPELKFLDDPMAEDKCHGRDDLRCSVLNAGTVCLPACGKDSQCDGRLCDPRTGFCVDTIAAGKPLGAACNADAKVDECAGFCQKFTGSSSSVCSSPCVLGDSDLLNTNDCGGLDKGLCVFRPTGYGSGDFGRCTLACTEHDQCANPNWWCSGNNFALNGYCFTTPDCKTTTDCAMSGPEHACIKTKFGSKCLELDADCVKGGGDEKTCALRFPLGDAAPEATGAGGAGGAG